MLVIASLFVVTAGVINKTPSLSLVASGGVALALLCLIVGNYTYVRGPARWNTYQVKGGRYYSNAQKGWVPLPQFARELATNIQAMRPRTTFEVTVLEQDRLQLDPVLYAVEDDVHTPVKVWDDKDIVVLPPMTL